MAIVSKNIVNINDIDSEFTANVVNVILSNIYDLNNIPMDGSRYCIEPERLGNRNNLVIPSVGITKTTVSAANLYNNLVAIATLLTRVGTFSYVRTYGVNSGSEVHYSISGKALFSDAYIRELSNNPPHNDIIVSGKVINSKDINTLFANLLLAWSNTSKHHNIVSVHTCHTNCHSNCHSDCHSDGGCYK